MIHVLQPWPTILGGTWCSLQEVLRPDPGEDKYRPGPLLRKMVDAGWLVRRTGRGFYKYP